MFNVEWKGKSFVFFNRVSEASSHPRTERRSVKNHHNEPDSDEEESRSYSFSPTPEPVPSAPPPQSNNSDSYYSGPFKALYDFESGKESRKKNYSLITSGVSCIDVFSRKTTDFHRWALFERWSNQADKTILTAVNLLEVSSL